jgi:hypothetical protein
MRQVDCCKQLPGVWVGLESMQIWSHSIRLQSHCIIEQLYGGKALYFIIKHKGEKMLQHVDRSVKWILMNMRERERERWCVTVSGPAGLLAFNSSCFEVLDDSDKKLRDLMLFELSPSPHLICQSRVCVHNNERDEPTAGYRWIGWVWEISGSNSKLEKNFWSI